MKKTIAELELKLSSKEHPRLLTKENALFFIKELHQHSITIYGFEGFNVGHDIASIEGFEVNKNSIQPEQDFSRDYSKFTKDETFRLCLEYFSKDRSVNTLYEISYNRNT